MSRFSFEFEESHQTLTFLFPNGVFPDVGMVLDEVTNVQLFRVESVRPPIISKIPTFVGMAPIKGREIEVIEIPNG